MIKMEFVQVSLYHAKSVSDLMKDFKCGQVFDYCNYNATKCENYPYKIIDTYDINFTPIYL